MKETICNYLEEALQEIPKGVLADLVEIPPEKEMGDLTLPCFALAKILRKGPKIIAEELKYVLEPEKETLGVERIVVVNGYLNLFLDRKQVVQQVLKRVIQENLGIARSGVGKTICMDYSSPNIAKNFHVGHLRTTIIGNSLYKIYDKLGYDVVRINHLGDWGTQFGKLIVAYKKYSSKEKVEKDGIEELLRIYVQFNTEAETQPSWLDEAREWFVKMEQNDEEALQIWNWFKEISMVEFERVYKLLGMEFDSYKGESFYRSRVPELVEQLRQRQLLTESQGAQVIDLSEDGMPPCMILKNDGGSIYHSRDMAAAIYRKEKYDFDKCLYVTGLEQTLHFKQVFRALELMEYDWVKNLVHVPYGLVSLGGRKLSTRKGNIIYAEDILKEAILRAQISINEKNPDLEEKGKVAKQVGVGAVIFHDLFNQRTKNIEFHWDEVLSFDGATGPYVQYTCARAKSILRKCNVAFRMEMQVEGWKENLCKYLTDDTCYELIKILGDYEAAVKEAAFRYEPSVIARYVMKVATAFNKFYHDCPIMKAEENCKNARIFVVDAVQRVIMDACGLLGMECPDQM